MAVSPEFLIDMPRAAQLAEADGPRRWTYPFLQNGDIVAAYFEEDYWQTLATFLPDTMKIPYSLALADFFLIKSFGHTLAPANIMKFTRTWSRVPATQTVQQSMMVTRPSIPSSYGSYTTLFLDGTSIATTNIFRFAEAYFIDGRSLAYYDAYQMKTVSSSAIIVATGGTFTFTYKTSTTAALAYNAADITIAAAINALADIASDGITVTSDNRLGSAGNGFINIVASVGSFAAAPAVNAASLTPTLSTMGDNSLVTSTSFIYANRIGLVSAGHGLINSGQKLSGGLTTSVNGYIVGSTNWSVGDANTVLVKSTVLVANIFLSATANFIGAFVKQYTPGSSPVSVNAVTQFSLSAIAPGTYQGDTYNFLVQIFAGNIAINYQVGDSARWPDEMSVMNSLTTIQVSAANL